MAGKTGEHKKRHSGPHPFAGVARVVGENTQMHYNHRKNCTFFSRGDHYLQYLSSVLIFTTTMYLWQASGVHSHGEDQAGAAGQLHLVWKEEEAVQRQVFGKTQRRYTVHSDA